MPRNKDRSGCLFETCIACLCLILAGQVLAMIAELFQ